MLNTLDRQAMAPRWPDVPRLLRRAFAANAPLALIGLGSMALLIAALISLLADPTVITGAPAWMKPLKFAVSTAVYAFTLLWLLGYVQGHRRLVGLISIGTAAGFLVELTLIVVQVVRGQVSHFNVGTPLDAFIYGRMRDFIVLVFLLGLVTAILLQRQHLPDPAWAAALRSGIGLALVGMAVAVLMTVPLPATRASFGDGRAGAHSVGVADGGPGLPIVGWSTTGGDLRIAHFVGLHALQLLPLLGWMLSRPRFAWLGRGGRLALVRTTGLSYLGLILVLTWQALRGQSIVAPDTRTLAVSATLLAVTILAVAIIAFRARRAAIV